MFFHLFSNVCCNYCIWMFQNKIECCISLLAFLLSRLSVRRGKVEVVPTGIGGPTCLPLGTAGETWAGRHGTREEGHSGIDVCTEASVWTSGLTTLINYYIIIIGSKDPPSPNLIKTVMDRTLSGLNFSLTVLASDFNLHICLKLLIFTYEHQTATEIKTVICCYPMPCDSTNTCNIILDLQYSWMVGSYNEDHTQRPKTHFQWSSNIHLVEHLESAK
jgi:hypothetical protein